MSVKLHIEVGLLSLLEGLPEAVMLEDDQRSVVWHNDAFDELFAMDSASADIGLGFGAVRDPIPFTRRTDELVGGGVAVHSEEVHFLSGRVFERDYIPFKCTDGTEAHLWHYREVTAHHRARRRLALGQARLAEVVERVPIGGFAMDSRGRVVAMNRNLRELTGLEQGNADREWAKLLHPEDRDHVLAHLRASLRHREPSEIEYRMIDPRGRVLDLILKMACIDDEEGAPLHLGVVEDVTEARARERAASALLHITASPLDFADRLKLLVDAGAELLGMRAGIVSRLEDGHLTVLAARDPDGPLRAGLTIDPAQTPCGLTLSGDEPVVIEDTARAGFDPCTDAPGLGIRSYVGVPILVGGRPWGAISFFSREPRYGAFLAGDRDLISLMAQWIGGVVEQRQAEQAQSASEAHAAASVATALDAIVVVDHDGRIVRFNPAAERVFGISQRAALGCDMAELIVPPDARAAHSAGFARFLTERTSNMIGKRIELVAQRADGTRFPAELAVASVLDADQPSFTAFIRDISERRQFERELADAHDRAVEATRAKSEFLAVMSHEIRTPMNGVIGTVELLEETGLSAEQGELVAVLGQSAQALLGIINDILDFSKVEAGKLELRDETFELAEIAEAAVDVVAPTASSRGVSLSAFVDPSLPSTVCGDAGRLRQVMLNLVGNAVKFTESGQVSLEVLPASSELADHIGLEIRVVDTGIGIEPDLVEHLFQPFVQGDGSRTRRYSGTGLGLVICDRLTRLMGGYTCVESTSSAGTTMLAAVRVKRAVDQGAPAPEGLRGRRVTLEAAPSRLTDAIAAYLERWKITVQHSPADTTAPSPHSDLTILDCRDRDPYEVARERTTPTLLILNRPAPDLANDNRYVLAPVHRHSLLREVTRLLGGEAIADRPPSRTKPEMAAVLQAGTILVAEDDSVNRMLALRQLARLGVAARAVCDGREAVEAAASGTYALILMDCRMPVLDGYGATRAIRAAESAGDRRTPIIALTADILPRDRDACIEAGMDDYLSKPLTLDALRAVLTQWLTAPTSAAARTPAVEPSLEAALSALGDQLGDGDAVIEVTRTWLEEAPGLCTRLQTAAAARDLAELALVSHRFKSTGFLFGADALSELAAGLERSARSGDLSAAAQVPGLIAALEQLRDELAAWTVAASSPAPPVAALICGSPDPQAKDGPVNDTAPIVSTIAPSAR